MQPVIAIYLLWVAWFLAWLAAWLWTSRTVRRLTELQEVGYRTLVIIGSVLLFGLIHTRYDMEGYRFWVTLKGTPGWCMVGLAAVAILFSIWSRIHLGRFWASGKERDQNVIQSGPYRVVRRPIYSGVILAAFATAMVFGTPSSLAGAVLLGAAFVFKSILEEQFLREELAGAYDDYAERVPMMVPLLNLLRLRDADAEPSVPSRTKRDSAPPPSDLREGSLTDLTAASSPEHPVRPAAPP